MQQGHATDEGPFIPDTDPIISELLPGYLANRHRDLGKIDAAVAAADFAVLRKIGHDMKGSGAAYGLAPISDLGELLERAALDGDAGTAARLRVQLDRFLARVVVD